MQGAGRADPPEPADGLLAGLCPPAGRAGQSGDRRPDAWNSAADKQRRRFADLDLGGFKSTEFLHFGARRDGRRRPARGNGEAAKWIKARHGIPLIGGRMEVLDRLELRRGADWRGRRQRATQIPDPGGFQGAVRGCRRDFVVAAFPQFPASCRRGVLRPGIPRTASPRPGGALQAIFGVQPQDCLPPH